MIATSFPIVMSIWILVVASLLQSWHLVQVSKRHAALQRRVFELEMERDFPGFTRRPAPSAPDDSEGGGLPSG